MWHLLQVSDVLDIEFGAALAERVPLMAWEPERVLLPSVRRTTSQRSVADPPFRIHKVALLRGFAKPPWSFVAFTGFTVSRHLLQHTPQPMTSPLICTTPYFAPVAEAWPGPVIYWLTDRMERYDGANPAAVHRLDARMCKAASLVCPNSQRLAEYLIAEGKCPADKIQILPNATRETNLLPSPPNGPGPLPADLAGLTRPIAGVIGNLAGNMDWEFLESLIHLRPELNWAFVGPTTTPIESSVQNAARVRVMQQPNTHFVGRKPYGELAAYARAFDLAVLPYQRREPTYSGSSTRFYEHLAACRPMVATRAFEELLRKEPLVHLVDTAEQAADYMERLAAKAYTDGFEKRRWKESQAGTWQARADTLIQRVYALPAMLKCPLIGSKR